RGRLVELDDDRVRVGRAKPETVEVRVNRAGARGVHAAVVAGAGDGLVEERVDVAGGERRVQQVLPAVHPVACGDRLAVAPLCVLAQVERVCKAVRRYVEALRAERFDVARVCLGSKQAVVRLDGDGSLIRVGLLRGVQAVRLSAGVCPQDLLVRRSKVGTGLAASAARSQKDRADRERQRPTPSTYLHTRLTSQMDPAAFFPKR